MMAYMPLKQPLDLWKGFIKNINHKLGLNEVDFNTSPYGLKQKRCNSSANALELHPFCIKSTIFDG